jgi:repressor LexA
MRKPGKSITRDRILQYIRVFVDERGYAPTVRDIVKGCSLSSTAVVQHHLNILEKEGAIHRDPEIFRSIQLTEKNDIFKVHLLGTIAAGEPIPVPTSDTWINDSTETIDVPRKLAHGKDVYALRVKGLSMIDALIDDGDVVLMQATKSADSGDMVAVWLKDREEVTLKKIYFENQKIRLQPANMQMQPLIVDPSTVEIQGKVVGVIRKLL